MDEGIGNLSSINDYNKFINNTVCDLLDELIDKRDIRAFFKIILNDVIENLEISSGESKIMFDAVQIENIIIQRKKSVKKNLKKQTSKTNNNCIIVYSLSQRRKEEEKKIINYFFLIILLIYL